MSDTTPHPDPHILFKGLNPIANYDKATALSLAVACEIAYREKPEIENKVQTWNYQMPKFIEVKKGKDIDTQCYVMTDDENVVVVFRGSESLADWFANFQAVRDPGPFEDTKAHEGFQDALFPAVINLTNTLDSFNVMDKKLWLTGHSLGGALCSLYAGMLIENDYPVHGIYTFASPRPANGPFAEELNAKVKGPHYRVVNSGDIVPHVPPEPFFSHAGKRMILEATQSTTKDTSWFEERIDALKFFINNTLTRFDVDDIHRLNSKRHSYIPRLYDELQRP